MRKYRKIIAITLSLLILSLSGCKDKEISVDDYGDMEQAADEKKEESENNIIDSSESLSEMLGDKELEYTKPFNLCGKNATIDVAFKPNDTDILSVYNIEPIDEATFDEKAIVSNLMGDTAVALNSDERKYLNVDLDDSQYVISSCQYVLYHNKGKYNIMANSCPTWVDEDTYYIHTYEGKYNGVTSQLMISYSKNYDEFVVVLYPKLPGEVVGNPSFDMMGDSSPDGKFYYWYSGSVREIVLDEDMKDRPNECAMSDDDLTTTVNESLKNAMNLSYPMESMSLYENTYNVVINSDKAPVRNEMLFYNTDAVKSGTMEGAVRNGYMMSVMKNLCNQRIMTDTEVINDKADELQTGMVSVNDSGVYAFVLTTKYNFKDKVTDNAQILSFEKAMDAFVEAAEANIQPENLENADATINFSSVELVYFPVIDKDIKNNGRLIPAWSIEAQNEKRQTVVRILIDATDGSFITALNESE